MISPQRALCLYHDDAKRDYDPFSHQHIHAHSSAGIIFWSSFDLQILDPHQSLLVQSDAF